jgi:hypothetical protein
MRYFSVLDFQYIVLLIFLGLVSLIILYVAFGPTGRTPKDETIEEFPDGIREKNNPIPAILIFLYAGYAVWAISYVVYRGMGAPF